MSSKNFLQHKIWAHLEAKKRAEQLKAEQADRFEANASTFYSQLETSLTGIDGVDVYQRSAVCPDITTYAQVLCIKVLDKTVTFEPEEQDGDRGFNVTGLFDRPMFYRPLESGDWEANDERSSRAVLFSEQVLFDRLADIVPR